VTPSPRTAAGFRLIDQDTCRRNMQGAAERAPSYDRQRRADALGIAGRQVFHRYALFVPAGVLYGWMAFRSGNGRVNELATYGC
jgi:hypothetical protein